jgi:hypothetical protein
MSTQQEIRTLIMSIRDIRARNNDIWCDLLEVAVLSAPDQVIAILNTIIDNDQRVTANTKLLVGKLVSQLQRGVLAD